MCEVFPVSCQWYINNSTTFDTKLDVFDKLTGGVLPSHVLELCGPSGLYRQSADIFIKTTRIGGLLELEQSLVHQNELLTDTVSSGSGKSRLCYHLIASCLEEDDKHVVLISSKTVPSSVVSGLPNKNSKLPSSKKVVVLNSLIVRQTSVY